MGAKRILTIVLGVSAAAWLMLSPRGVFDRLWTGPQPAPITLETPARRTEVTDVSSDPVRPPDTHPRELESATQQTPLTLPQSVDTSEAWGRSFDECKTKHIVAIGVCKHRFERRDPNWAPEAEQRIRDFVADTPLLRLPAEDDPSYHLECRATFCQVHLYVDRARLTDHLRSLGRYEEGASLAREHEFMYLTFHSRWAADRAEELRVALVFSGLLRADAAVDVEAFEPAYREQDSFLLVELSRCPNLNDLCAAQ